MQFISSERFCLALGVENSAWYCSVRSRNHFPFQKSQDTICATLTAGCGCVGDRNPPEPQTATIQCMSDVKKSKKAIPLPQVSFIRSIDFVYFDFDKAQHCNIYTKHFFPLLWNPWRGQTTNCIDLDDLGRFLSKIFDCWGVGF